MRMTIKWMELQQFYNKLKCKIKGHRKSVTRHVHFDIENDSVEIYQRCARCGKLTVTVKSREEYNAK